MRQIILDTETTGLETSQGHRIIEIGCVEVINRRITDNHWHHYIQPDREIDAGAFEVHGISNDFLADKPRFEDLAEDFVNYARGAELVIHNAPFDIGFLNYEIDRLNDSSAPIDSICGVLDTLVLARQKHPGQKNNLDALCKRYMIDNTQRTLHGALLDARILADVYLAMTGGQTALGLDEESGGDQDQMNSMGKVERELTTPLHLWQTDEIDDKAHQEYLEFLAGQSDDPVWKSNGNLS